MEQLKFSLATYLLLVPILGILIIVLLGKQNWRNFLPKRDPSISVIPGDPGLPLIGHLHQLFTSGKGCIHLFHSWTLRHGDICKFSLGPWKHVVLINNANMIQKLLTSKEHLSRPPFIYEKIFDYSDLFRFGLAMLPVPRWKEHRTILNRAFTYNSLQSYIPTLNKFGRDIVSQILTETEGGDVEKGTVIPLFKHLHIATLQAISFVTLGEIIFSPSHRQDTLRFHENFEDSKSLSTELILKPWLLIKPIWYFHSIRKKLLRVMEEMENYFQKMIAQSKHVTHEAHTNPVTPLELEEGIEVKEKFRSLIELMQEEGDMNKAEVCAEAATFILAGHETVSTSMMFLMYNLAVNRNHQRECQKEIDSMFEMAPASGNVGIQSFQNLKHLERCIKESLRIYPTFSAFAREAETSSLNLSDDHNIPPGTIILVSPWTLHRNPEYYPDPEKFDPDRFLPENSQKRNTYAYMPFCAGSRDCIGWKLAMMEMLVLSSWILHHFDIFAEPDDPKHLKIHFGITLSTEPEVRFVLKRRLGSSQN